MQLSAPAKINLSFRILRRRADGFHEIETLMAPVSLSDQLTISRTGKNGAIELVCDDPSLPTGDDNLVVRAARLFLQAIEQETGLRISLEKRIPHGAGLGGGSSDAASVLLGLNELCEANLSEDELAQVGAQIGSDVPFFIFRSAAICSGRGELVVPTKIPSPLSLLMLKPGFDVPTPWAYSRWQNSKELSGIGYDPQQFGGVTFVNDLERPVFEKHVFLAHTKMWLLRQPQVGAAIMSGSGSTVFAALREDADAQVLADRAKTKLDPEMWTYACKTI